MTKIIGKVSATESNPSTIDEFYFWTDKKQILGPFDVVKVAHEDNSITYGVVEEINHVTDAPSHFTSFISSDFGDVNDNVGNMNRLGMNYVKVRVSCNTKDVYTPVLDGRQVSLCDENDVRTALGLREEDVKDPLACGYLQMYKGDEAIRVKVVLDAHFLIGPEGAHLNISGISGLAAKTSYSMFLLRAIQEKFRDDENNKVSFVLFNVKGRDLMAIDEPNSNMPEKDKSIYSDLELTGSPFENVTYYYPYSNNSAEGNVQSYADLADVKKQKELHKAKTYKFQYDKCIDKLDLLLANEDDASGTMESCVNYIINGQEPFQGLHRWDKLLAAIQNCTVAGNASSRANNDIQVTSWRKFKRCVSKAIQNNVFGYSIEPAIGEVDLAEEIANNLRGGQIMVIDMARLDDSTQAFVFGSVARSIYDLKLGAERDDIPQKIIIFVDELNKYAPKGSAKSPITHQLLDIAERGRSLGIILFAVEQFRSAVEERVIGNCATHAYGRTNSMELSKSDYKGIPRVYQNMLTRLSPGEYIVSSPALRSFVNVKFPRPAYKQFPNG